MSLNGTPTLMYCDDYTDNISQGESWNVTGLTLAAITAGPASTPPQYGASTNPPLTQAEIYIAAVDLAVQINDLTAGPNEDQERRDLSAALWAVTDPGQLLPYLSAPGCGVNSGCANSEVTGQALIDYNAAIAQAISDENPSGSGVVVTEIGGYSATVYTPVAGTQSTGGAPQEFIALTVPEPSSLAVLGLDFVGAGLVGLYFFRRKSRARS